MTNNKDQSIEEIISGLSSNSETSRLKALSLTYELKDKEFYKPVLLPSLLKLLEEDPSIEVRCKVIYVLRDSGYAEAIEPIIEATKSDFYELRKAALVALYMLKDERSIPALLDAVKDDDSTIRSNAVNTLGNYRNESVFKTLIEVLKNDVDLEVHATAASSLSHFDDKRAIEPLLVALNEKSDDKDDNSSVRIEAAMALSRFKEEWLFEPLYQMFNDQDENIRYYAIQALGELGDARGVDPLLSVLTDHTQNAFLRERAAEGLGNLKNDEGKVIKALVDALDEDEETNTDITIGLSAAYSLSRLGEIGLKALSEASNSLNPNRRNNAITVLNKINK